MRGWRTWYEDGSIYSSLEMQWAGLPKSGLQVVCVYEDRDYKPGFPYRKIINGCDWYYLAPDGSIEGIRSDSWDSFRPRPCGVSPENIKKGTAVSDEQFNYLIECAQEARHWL